MDTRWQKQRCRPMMNTPPGFEGLGSLLKSLLRGKGFINQGSGSASKAQQQIRNSSFRKQPVHRYGRHGYGWIRRHAEDTGVCLFSCFYFKEFGDLTAEF